jgi:7,8-dihydroneopterin aldolase/epimerase/oxygenase
MTERTEHTEGDGGTPGQHGMTERTEGHRGTIGRIELRGLRVRGNHGVYDFERAEGQDFVVDVALDLDLGKAAVTDDVADTVHYGELAEKLAAVVAGEPVNLIETLADRLLTVCLDDPRVGAATVTVHKPQAPIPHEFADVAVTVRRTR